ncbi:MAG: arginine deiminase-related protein [Chitinophagaceae bacterium]
MIRPAGFGFNTETAVNNYFQSAPRLTREQLQQAALAEFDNMVQILRRREVKVLVTEDTAIPPRPDAVFPNNWLSTSPEGKLFVFPMFAASRRAEKREDILQELNRTFIVKELQDWSEYEAEGRFLEGTGSMVTDHDHRLIYAAISERTNLSVLEKFAATNGYQAIVFLATDKENRPVYHTNVMMALGQQFCVICEEAIEEEWELIAVRQLLESTGHSVIPITREQMGCFAGNMLEVKNSRNESLLVLSQSAFDALRRDQKEQLETCTTLLPIPVPVIEQAGGGSVRCMMTEIFLERNT